MSIQLDKILADIADEKILRPNNTEASKKDIEEAWARVGKNNKLSVHEARSIFKVLQKKYAQEKFKEKSTWKLFNIMEQIHKKEEDKPDIKEEEIDMPMEEDEEYEMLDVQEEEEPVTVTHGAQHSAGSGSDNESPNKSIKSHTSEGSSEKDDMPLSKPGTGTTKATISIITNNSNPTVVSSSEEKKLLNTLAPVSSRLSASSITHSSAATAAALNKKGITLRKSTTSSTPANTYGSSRIVNAAVAASQLRNLSTRSGRVIEVGKTIQLPESIKRKLSEDTGNDAKKISLGTLINQSISAKSTPTAVAHTTTAQLMQIKQERTTARNDLTNGLVGGGGGASSSAAATIASTSTNGFSPRIEDIDFRNDIIFDVGTGVNGGTTNKTGCNTSEIINLGNFDNSLPPIFFKNLCNSSRHEALGLYVANVMNRLRHPAASKLELNILRAIIDAQNDDIEQ